jgi:glycosyltransferase involved in cell wall biosynthesis
MAGDAPARGWVPGSAPVAVVLLALNEGHQMAGVLENLRGFAQEVFLVDSRSSDDTVDIALAHGVHVVQRPFRGFGDQWNFALRTLPVRAPWTMKVDPDERLSDALKAEIGARLRDAREDAFTVPVRLHFLGRALPRRLRLVRLWRSGAARFSDVAANEHAHVAGTEGALQADIEHHDSPDLTHWLAKQNRYSQAEAAARFRGDALAAAPRLAGGGALSRRMWLKRHFWSVPGRYALLYLHHLFVQGAWRAGSAGRAWAHLRTEVFRMQEYKYREMCRLGRVPAPIPTQPGAPDPRVPQHE